MNRNNLHNLAIKSFGDYCFYCDLLPCTDSNCAHKKAVINEYNKYLKMATSGDYNKLKTESYDIHTNDILRILNDTREYGYAAAEYFRKETIEKLK